MLQLIVNPLPLIHLGDCNNLLFFIDEEENPVSNSQTEGVLFTFDLLRLGGEWIFEAQDFFTGFSQHHFSEFYAEIFPHLCVPLLVDELRELSSFHHLLMPLDQLLLRC